MPENLLLAIILIAIVVSFFSLWRSLRFEKRLKQIFTGSKSQDLEGVISQSIKQIKKTEKELKFLQKDYKVTKEIALESIHKVGIVRYNPFKETGGDHSFSLALLNENNNGLVVTSLYLREGQTRIYSKPIEGGSSRYELSHEELEAIKRARARAGKF